MSDTVHLKGDGCMYVGKQHHQWIQNKFLHWKISTLSPSCKRNVHKLSQTSCVHQCIHCHPFLCRRALRLLMDPSAYQSPSIQPEFSGYVNACDSLFGPFALRLKIFKHY